MIGINMQDIDGGHGSFNVQNEIDSFAGLDSRLALQHPDWTNDQRHKEALILFNTKMFPKQVKSFMAEQSGSESMDVDEGYDVVGDKLVHPLYGDFDRMIDNAKTPKEKESLRLYQETMVRAVPGTRVMTVDLHAESDGEYAIRYADISIKTSDGKVRVEKRVDIAGKNRPLTLEESWSELVNAVGSGNEKKLVTSAEHQVGILVLEPPTVQTEATPQTNFTKRPDVREAVKRDVVDHNKNLQEFNQKVEQVPYVQEKELSLTQNVRFEYEGRIGNFRTLALIAETGVGIGAVPLLLISLAKELPLPLRVMNKSIERHERNVLKRKKKQERLLKKHDITESVAFMPKSERIRRKRRKRTMKENERPVTAVFTFEKTSGKKTKRNRKERTMKKREVGASKRYIYEAKIKTVENGEGVIKQRGIRKEAKRMRKEMRRSKKERVMKMKRKNVERKGFISSEYGQRLSKKSEVKRTELTGHKIEYRLMRVLRKLMRREASLRLPIKVKSPEIQKSEQMRSKKEFKKRQRENVLRFSFAIVLLLLLTPQKEIDGEKRLEKIVRDNKSEQHMLMKDQSPWLLLSIIWYLAMIREMGNVNSYQFSVLSKKKRKNKNKKAQDSSLISLNDKMLAQSGIIFAFHS